MPHSTPPIGHGSQNRPTELQSSCSIHGPRNSRHRAVIVASDMMMPHTAPVRLS